MKKVNLKKSNLKKSDITRKNQQHYIKFDYIILYRRQTRQAIWWSPTSEFAIKVNLTYYTCFMPNFL